MWVTNCLPSGSLAIKRLMMAPSGPGVVRRSWRLSLIHQSWHYSESQIYCTYDIESFYRFYSSLDMQRHIGILKCYAFLILYNMKLDHPKKDAWSPVVGPQCFTVLGVHIALLQLHSAPTRLVPGQGLWLLPLLSAAANIVMHNFVVFGQISTKSDQYHWNTGDSLVIQLYTIFSAGVQTSDREMKFNLFDFLKIRYKSNNFPWPRNETIMLQWNVSPAYVFNSRNGSIYMHKQLLPMENGWFIDSQIFFHASEIWPVELGNWSDCWSGSTASPCLILPTIGPQLMDLWSTPSPWIHTSVHLPMPCPIVFSI